MLIWLTSHYLLRFSALSGLCPKTHKISYTIATMDSPTNWLRNSSGRRRLGRFSQINYMPLGPSDVKNENNMKITM
jgi:hypothetical protein